MKAALGLVLWAFVKKDSSAAIAEAEAAGVAAVAAAPSKGVEDSLGTPVEFE